MADVESHFTVTEKRTRKVKKTTKRRESGDQSTEITEVQRTNGEGYVCNIDPCLGLLGLNLDLLDPRVIGMYPSLI